MLLKCFQYGRLRDAKDFPTVVTFGIGSNIIQGRTLLTTQRKKSRKDIATESNLHDELREAKQEYETTPNDSNATRLNAAQEKLETFYEDKTKGIIIRARARWHEHREKNTKYFLNVEKKNHIKKHGRKLHISGVIKTDPFCILKEQETFYKNLYKSSTTDQDIIFKISSFLNDFNIPALSEDQTIFSQGKISAEQAYCQFATHCVTSQKRLRRRLQ